MVQAVQSVCSVCVLVCVFARQMSSELNFDLDVRRGSSQRKSVPFSAESESVKLGKPVPVTHKKTRLELKTVNNVSNTSRKGVDATGLF